MTAPQPGLGVDDDARVPRLLHQAVRRQGRPADLPDRLRPARHRGRVDLAAARSAIESTIEYLKAEHGPQEWEQGMHPEIPAHEALNNPYTYREDVSAWKETG